MGIVGFSGYHIKFYSCLLTSILPTSVGGMSKSSALPALAFANESALRSIVVITPAHPAVFPRMWGAFLIRSRAGDPVAKRRP
jgi:hypothetical protein